MPSSHLTRQVFRRLLANEPIVHRGCLRKRPCSSYSASATTVCSIRRPNGVQAARPSQRRTFFNFNMFRKARREIKEADMDPGIEKMMELEKMQRMRARLPHPADVAKAFDDFFHAKKKQQREALEDTQALLALQSLKYCLASQQEQAIGDADGGQAPFIDEAVLYTATYVLRHVPKQYSDAHVELAQLVYEGLVKSSPMQMGRALVAYCTVLSQSGSPETARDLLLQRSNVDTDETKQPTRAIEEEGDGLEEATSETDSGDGLAAIFTRAWLCVLKGFARKQDRVGVYQTLEVMRDRGYDRHKAVSRIMLNLSVSQDDIVETRKWWEEYVRQMTERSLRQTAAAPSYAVVDRVLKWCLRSRNLEFGHEVVKDVMKTNPPKPLWDPIFVWAAGTGKGVDEISRMIDVMERSNEGVRDQAQWRVPDIATINALVDFAISKDDPYMAERYIALGRDRGIEPDARTFVLQMDYRLSVNDVDGALTAYKNLQAMDLSDDEDLPTVNKLLVALCTSKRHDFDTIMNVAADLSDRRARFEPLTVATLSLLHLNRDELHDVIDLLNTHAFHYSSTERSSIRDAIVSYCIDPSTPTPRSWDAYTIIRNVFDELPRDSRTELMTNFFKRDRPDMAVHVFNHMRTHSRLDTIPTIDTYIAAFMGSARLHDLESLEVLHNQLKLDYNIDLNTRLRNALVIAYTSCNRPRKALGFWDDIVASREGPSYNSIHIALRACEKSPFGDLKAKEIWEKLRKMSVELDSTMWASYIAALAGNGNTRQAIRALEEAEVKGELEVDVFVLGSLFMGAPGMDKQREIEVWGKQKYPRVWAELVKTGVEEDEVGTRTFGIDRSVTP